MVFAGADTVYAIGYEGTVLKSTDSSITWTSVGPENIAVSSSGISGTKAEVKDITAIDENSVWITAEDVWHTTDGGISWVKIEFPYLQNPNDLNQTPRKAIATKDEFIDALNGYMELSGAVMKTDDGGEHWYALDKKWDNTINPPQFFSMIFTPTGKGIISTNYDSNFIYGASVPGTPVNVQVITGEGLVNLTWEKASGYGTLKYKVERAREENGEYTQLTGGTSKLYYTDNSAEDNTTYYYRLTAINDVGAGPSVTVSRPQETMDECFIATAAYGSKYQPAVALLRHFRDDFLMKSGPGRAFVELYYHSSPPLAKIIADHAGLKALTRILLTPIVAFVWLLYHPFLLVLSAVLLLLIAILLLVVKRKSINACS